MQTSASSCLNCTYCFGEEVKLMTYKWTERDVWFQEKGSIKVTKVVRVAFCMGCCPNIRNGAAIAQSINQSINQSIFIKCALAVWVSPPMAVRGAFKKFCNSIWWTNDTSKIFVLLFNIITLNSNAYVTFIKKLLDASQILLWWHALRVPAWSRHHLWTLFFLRRL